MIGWYYLVIISTLISVIISIIQKRTLRVEHATQYSSATSLLLAFALLIFLPFANFSMTPLQLALTIASGVISGVVLLYGTRITRHSNISAVAPLSNSLPILFTVLFAFLFLGEALSIVQYISVGGIMAVTYLLMFRKKHRGLKRDFDSKKYKYYLVGNAIIGSIGAIVIKYMLVNINIYAFMIVAQITTAACLLGFATYKYGGLGEIKKVILRYRATLLTIVGLIVALRVIYYLALTVAPISVSSTLSNAIFVMLTVPIGGILFKEDDIRRKTLLSAAILAFAYLLVAN